jgi:hypothetical protein
VQVVEVVLAITVTTDDWNLLRRSDVVPGRDGGSLCESEEMDKGFRLDDICNLLQ